jgi:tetraacyldisaccharide 4'-kinase
MHRLQHYWYCRAPIHLILLPLSGLFGLLAALRRQLYRLGWLSSAALPVPVVIVGNITVGGSGKTPFTLWMAERLLEAGWHPVILSRGYGGSQQTARAVQPDDSPTEVGDEPLLMAQRRLCPVWIGRDRLAAGQALLNAHPECDILLCDDGLQHYRLQRNLEIVVIDNRRGFGNGWLLPAGPLREPLSRLAKADAIVLHGGTPQVGQYAMELHGETFYNLLNPQQTATAADFQGQRLHALAGIGHPQRFFDHLHRLGLEPLPHPFPDHHAYCAEDLAFPDADAILMTEKDAVKCAAIATEQCWVLRVDARLDPALFEHLLERLSPHGRQTA